MAATAQAPILKRRITIGETVEKLSGLAILLGLAVWVIANVAKDPKTFFEVLLSGLNNGALYALIALGYTLVYGIIELINFAHGDLFMLGTIISANVVVEIFHAKSPGVGAFLLMTVGLVITMIFCAGLNMSAEFFAYRRLRRAPKLAPLITAVGLSFIFQNMGQKMNCRFSDWFQQSCQGSGQKNWPSVLGQSGFTIAGVKIENSLLVVLAVTAVLLTLLTFIVKKTKQGKAMRATAQDQDGARLMGINVDRTISFTFALGGAMAGAAALLYLETIGTTRYDAGFQLGLIAFTAAVLGGVGNLVGAVVGGILIGVIQGVNDGAAYGLGQRWSQTVVFTILILLMVFKPEGLFGTRTTEKL